MDADHVQKLRAERLLVLRKLYELTGGNTPAMVSFDDLIAETSIPYRQLTSHMDYLRGEYLAEQVAFGMVAITHYGAKEIEDALDAPEQPTEHFPAIVVAETYVNIGGDVSGQVQVGTTGSTQSMAIPVDDMRALLADVRTVLDGLALEPDEKNEIDSDLRTVEVQLESPKPKSAIVREGLSSARSVLESVATREAAAGVTAGVEHLPGLIEKLGHAITLLS